MGHNTGMALRVRCAEPLETLCAFELGHHELDGCATRESREAQGESQPDPHALPGAKRAFGLVSRQTSDTWALHDDRQ